MSAALVIQFLLALIPAMAITGLLVRYAARFKLLDVPVARSAHDVPTPVGGGISILVVFLLVLLILHWQNGLTASLVIAHATAIGIALLGLLDDIYELHAKWRLPIQCILSVVAVLAVGPLPGISMGLFTFPSGWPLTVLSCLSLVWLLNLFNFMDGIDGIAGAEFASVNLLVLCFVIMGSSGDAQYSSLQLVMISMCGASCGFLVWNWSPAKIFMGDVGSSFCGFLLGILALWTMQESLMTLWAWVILLAVFVVDATYTLVQRLRQGEPWYQGHSRHTYQSAARMFKSHRKVTIAVIVINFLWLAPLAWMALILPELGVYLALIAVVPLLVLARRIELAQFGA